MGTIDALSVDQNEMTRRPNSRIAFTTSSMAREYLPVKDYLSSIPPRESN